VGLRLHLSSHDNETSTLCDWTIPESHYLEAWGDVRAFDGTVSVVQPLIEPLYRSKSSHEILAALLGDSSDSSYDTVRDYWRASVPEEDFEAMWRRALHDGVMVDTAFPSRSIPVQVQKIAEEVGKRRPATEKGLEVIFRPDPSVYDGTYANNAWLQELPKPLTKLTWDNAALLSPTMAEELELSSGDVVALTLQGRSVEAPIWIQPRHPEKAVTLHFGYGRETIGSVGKGYGFNAYRIRFSTAPWSCPGLQLTKTGKSYPLVSTQDHSSMEGRQLVRFGTLQDFNEEPDMFQHEDLSHSKDADLYPGFEYTGYAWGMVVDLNACTGCNACVVACQAENNISVVGKDQVASGREMHWLRIDRYHSGPPELPVVLHQPLMCQHCENAPCETVCPVAATVHSDEGLNDMVYNRCVGTRYCSNNCPYKVRRFNFLLYSDWRTPSLKLQRNPDVTVRSRGVMEKCSFCVQRINQAKIQAEVEEGEIRDGEIKTACQQTCPSDAIVFGNINDPNSRVAKLKASQRNYGILTELKTKPRTSYLAKLTNPNRRFKA
jgi:molybdopterin-containing oxidoreductase family iron-sulfur binding subunit